MPKRIRSLFTTWRRARRRRPAAGRQRHTALESLEPRQLLAADLLITEFMASNSDTLLDSDGASPDWIEIYNPGDGPIDLAGWSLTDDAAATGKWTFPTTPLDADGYLVVFASGKDRGVAGAELHTNFKLSAGGEYVALVSPDGTVVSEYGADGVDYPPQSADISYGLTGEGPDYLSTPTPGEVNAAAQLESAGETLFSVERGFFDAPFQVELTSDVEGITFRYTTDGTEPTETNGSEYTVPIAIDGTTVLRAAGFGEGLARGEIGTQTYLFLDDIVTQSPNGETPDGFPTGPVNSQQLDYGLDPVIVDSPIWGPQLREALTSIPTMSMVTDLDNLFGLSNGIYANAGGRGRAWERPTSLELINPDGSPGFQIDAGMRIRGGFSRDGNNPKHAFRLYFRDDYGGPQLDFPLFGEEGVDRFEKVDLRTSQNYSWAYQTDWNNTFLRDVFSRDTQGALGQPYTRSRFYHLYINGQYWGLYQTQERSEANYAATYFGGKSDDYDVVKSSIVAGDRIAAATDGNRDAYDRLYEATVQGFADNADYLRVQGRNLDGTRNPDYERLLDVDNLIDYMLITYYTADSDGPGSRWTLPSPNNFFAIYDRENPDGFKWFEHDSEHSLGVGPAQGGNMVSPLVMDHLKFNEADKKYFSAHWLHEKLMENADYRLRVADRVQKHFFGDGALTEANVLDRIGRRVAQIDSAIIAESARWGDSRQQEPPFTKENWESAARRMIKFTEGRVETVIKQMQEVGWLTEKDAPFIFASGDALDGPLDVSFDTGNALVYFTVDGSDPRLPGGVLNPEAVPYNRIDAYLDGDSNAKYLIPGE
ncbi:MAG: CotH kinase family protein, partial [Pirellulales bacterium]